MFEYTIPDSFSFQQTIILSCRLKVMVVGDIKKTDAFVYINCKNGTSNYLQANVNVLDYLSVSNKWIDAY